MQPAPSQWVRSDALGVERELEESLEELAREPSAPRPHLRIARLLLWKAGLVAQLEHAQLIARRAIAHLEAGGIRAEDAPEFWAAAKELLERAAPPRTATTAPPVSEGMLSGELGVLGIADVLDFLSTRRLSGTLRVRAGDREVSVELAEGALLGKEREVRETLLAMLRQEGGGFLFENASKDRPSGPKGVTLDTQFMLMDVIRALDESAGAL